MIDNIAYQIEEILKNEMDPENLHKSFKKLASRKIKPIFEKISLSLLTRDASYIYSEDISLVKTRTFGR